MSKQSIPLLALSIVAAGEIAAFRAVGYDDAQASVEGQKIKGVATSAAAQGDSITVNVAGTTIIETGDAIQVGDSLIVDDEGRAIPADPLAAEIKSGATDVKSTAANGEIVDLEGGDPPQYVFADALEAASGEGEFIEVKLR